MALPKDGNFELAWRIGRRVKEKARPFRKGTIRRRAGTGNNAQITVALDGGTVHVFSPLQLTLL